MINSVVFVSKETFENHIRPTESMIAVSIGERDDSCPELDRGFAAAIRLEFDDIDEESIGIGVGMIPDLHPRYTEGLRIFIGNAELCDFNDAKRIVEFIDKHASMEKPFDLVVHCHAGISRSAAVAMFAALHYGCPIKNANPDTSAANPRLLRLLNKVAGEVCPEIFEYRPTVSEISRFGLCAGVGTF